MLSAATVSLTGNLTPSAVPANDFGPALLPLILPVAVLAVPLVDLILAVFRRSRAGLAPWAPDKRHLHHRLLTLGHSHARAVLIMYTWSALIAGGTVSIAFSHSRTMLVISVLLGCAALLVVAVNMPRLRSIHRH
jgi:UDP-GlcNAc:undecaprenyl-phosphate GlcNAc-1-phosphate transferase